MAGALHYPRPTPRLRPSFAKASEGYGGQAYYLLPSPYSLLPNTYYLLPSFRPSLRHFAIRVFEYPVRRG